MSIDTILIAIFLIIAVVLAVAAGVDHERFIFDDPDDFRPRQKNPGRRQ